MHEDREKGLLRRALESGKTASKKAKSKQASPKTSRPTSKQASRSASQVQSREASDDEGTDGNFSDESFFSIDPIDLPEDEDVINEDPETALRDCIAYFKDSKGTSAPGREERLLQLVNLFQGHKILNGLEYSMPDLIDIFGRLIKAGGIERDVLLSMRALALAAITAPVDSLWETAGSRLKRLISDSETISLKAAGLHCLGMCITFGGAAEGAIHDELSYLLEIVSSDGAYVDAHDSAEVVTAALRVYGFLATQVDDLHEDAEEAITAFLDQLDSSDPDVQIAAGENIALLYEKSWDAHHHDEAVTELGDQLEIAEVSHDEYAARLTKLYAPYHNTYELQEKCSELANLSTHRVSKTLKRQLHQTFYTISLTLEDPSAGLRTNLSERNSGLRVRMHTSGVMDVDTWWKMLRLKELRRLLAGGFVNHYYEGNKQVLDLLPVLMQDRTKTSPRGYAADGARKRGRDAGARGKKGRERISDTRMFLAPDDEVAASRLET